MSGGVSVDVSFAYALTDASSEAGSGSFVSDLSLQGEGFGMNLRV